MAGGDRLQLIVTALSGASIAVTTQAAEKIYRAINTCAEINTTLKVCDTAKLAWLPQETIVFNHARFRRRTEVEISQGSEVLALESLVLGRAAHGERMQGGSISDTLLVRKDSRLVWGDTFRLTGDVFSHLSRKALLSDCTALATLLYFGQDFEAYQQLIRDLCVSLDCQCGPTLVGGLMVARFAAKSSINLKTALRKLLEEFRKGTGPFRMPKMWSC
jgi:urease accessory protein